MLNNNLNNIYGKINFSLLKLKKLIEELEILEEYLIRFILTTKKSDCMRYLNEHCFLKHKNIFAKINNAIKNDEEISLDTFIADDKLSIDEKLNISRIVNKVNNTNLIIDDNYESKSIDSVIYRIKELSYVFFLYNKFIDIDKHIGENYKINKSSIRNLLNKINDDFLNVFESTNEDNIVIDPKYFLLNIDKFFKTSLYLIKSYINQLDSMIGGGFSPGDFIIIAARPGIGKSSFCIDLMVKNVDETINANKLYLYFTPDMSVAQIYSRLMTRLVNKNIKNLKYFLNENPDKISYLENFPIIVSTTSDLNKIISIIDLYKNNISIIIIDYIQIINANNGKNFNKNEEIGFIISKLKDISREINALLIFVSQMNRDAEKKGSDVSLSNLRDSGFLEQESDVVMFLNKCDHNNILLSVMKNRNGITGEFFVDFSHKNFSFTEKKNNN